MASEKPVSSEKEESRRWFIQEIGRDAAALLLPVALPSMLSGQVCAPPGSTANPVAWQRDCRSIQARRPASTLTSSQLAKLKAAYKAMRDLATSDPADPRGFGHQTNIHCHNCGGGGSSIQVHGTLRFLPWHRAYLYFHEQILGKLITDPEFRLPYWDWENPSHRAIPSGYNSPNNATNPLFNSTRSMGPGDLLHPTSGQPATALSEANFNDFSSEIEGAPHGSVHVEVGGDMGGFDLAARDPIFYAHHANVDKVWSDWMKADASHTAPATAAWQNQTSGFFNQNKVWQTIRNIDTVDHEAKLRYIYAGRTWDFVTWRCLISWTVISTLLVANRNLFVLNPRVRDSVLKAAERSPVMMRIASPQLPGNKSANYFVYYDEAEAKANRGPQSPSYLGLISIVLASKEGRHPTPMPRKVDFEITPQRLKGLFARDGRVSLFFIENDRKDPDRNAAVSPLGFRSVQFLAGQEG